MAKKLNSEEVNNTTKETKEMFDPMGQVKAFLRENKEFHYNFLKEVYYKVSSGSLILDLETGGGLTPGAHRFTGVSEGGKSSCALSYARNFQLLHGDEGMVVYVKAEGRLSKDMLARSGL